MKQCQISINSSEFDNTSKIIIFSIDKAILGKNIRTIVSFLHPIGPFTFNHHAGIKQYAKLIYCKITNKHITSYQPHNLIRRELQNQSHPTTGTKPETIRHY
jgi:hypothetical protein